MSKAILVMDMPDNCQQCPCMYGGICFAKDKSGNPEDVDAVMTVEESLEGKPDWCPLRELPEKKPEKMLTKLGKYASTSVFELSELNIGFNACLDSIEGRGEHD